MKAFVILFLFTQVCFAQSIPFKEVLSTTIGPKSDQPLRGFNINDFDWTKNTGVKPSCKAKAAKKNVCSAKMVFVCSEYFNIATCVDQDLYVDASTGRPQGNMNLYACQSVCEAQGKRIPTNNEWQVACTGSDPYQCNTYYTNGGVYPPEYFSQVPGHVCNRAVNGPNAPYNSPCMTHPDLVAMLPENPAGCVSEAGVKACVGSFHQWVSNHLDRFKNHQGFRFNGGSFVVKASAVDYVTPAHDNTFYHYANGCRCAADPK